MNFNEQLKEKTKEAEQIVYQFLPEESGYQKTIFESMNYSVKAGGKRLRPILMNETYKLFGGKTDVIKPFMAAMEMMNIVEVKKQLGQCMEMIWQF